MAASGGASGGASGSIRAGRAHVELSGKDVGLSKTLDRIASRMKTFGKGVAKIGAGMFGVGAGGLGAGLAIFQKSIDRATGIKRLSDKLGVGTDELSAFAYAAKTTGMSLEDVTGQFENLAERVAQGAEGTGEAAETFKKLGIDAAKLKLQNPVQQMLTLAEAMEGVTNETDRLGMLSSLGGDQFQWMNNLFKGGRNKVSDLMKEGKDVGAVVDPNVAQQAERTEKAFSRAWTAIKSSILSVGEALLPQVDKIESVSTVIINLAKAVREFIGENQNLILGIGAAFAAIVAGGTALMTIGVGLGVAGAAFAGIVAGVTALGATLAVVGPLLVPIGIAVGVVTALGAAAVLVADQFGLLDDIFESVSETITVLGQGWNFLKEAFGTGLEGIKAALSLGDFSSAFQIAVATLDVVWQKFLLGLELGWAVFKDVFVDGWEIATTNVALAFVELGYQVRTIFDKLGTWLDSTFSSIIGNIARKIGSVIEAFAGNRFARDAMGLTNTKALKEIGQRLSGTTDPTLFKSNQAGIDAGTNELKQTLRDDLQRNLAERRVFRNDQIAKQLEKVLAAVGIQKGLVDAAKNKELQTTGLNVAMLGVMSTLAQDKKKEIVEGVQQSVGTKGSFSAAQASQYGAMGGNSTISKIELNTRNMVDKLDQSIDKLDALRDEYA